MDPLTIGGLFLGLAGGVASLFGLGQANQQASQNQAEETQLLNEAQQKANQENADIGLVEQRKAQEQELGGPTEKWNADATLLGDVAKETTQSNTPTQNQPTVALGI